MGAGAVEHYEIELNVRVTAFWEHGSADEWFGGDEWVSPTDECDYSPIYNDFAYAYRKKWGAARD